MDLLGTNIVSGDDGSRLEEVLSRVEESFVDWLSEVSDSNFSNSKSPMSCRNEQILFNNHKFILQSCS
jgi:hypothetical protein